MLIDNKCFDKIDKCTFISMIDVIDIGIHIVDSEGKTLFYNKAAESIDGLSKDVLMSKSMYELVNEGIFSSSVALEAIKERKTIKTIQRVNGRLIYSIGNPIFADGLISYVVVNFRDIEVLENMSKQLIELRKENKKITERLSKFSIEYLSTDQILSRSKEMKKVVRLAEKVAGVESNVLIEGESGVGKSMLARHIHQASERKNNSFIKLDCSAIPETLIESELFGYEEGSFTGAVKGGKKGLVLAANSGTLFLDEISELPLSSQSKLLSLIQDRQIQPIGSTKKIEVDVRIISATNQDLKKLVDEGKFRGDLYYRLKVIPIKIPPLRERKGDIVPLIRLFVTRLNTYYGLKKEISPSAIKVLLNYTWPGNVRELENVMERLLVTTEEERIRLDDVLTCINIPSNLEFSKEKTHKERVIDYEIKLINEYISKFNTIRDMAKYGGIDESTLRKKMERYGIKTETE